MKKKKNADLPCHFFAFKTGEKGFSTKNVILLCIPYLKCGKT